MMNPTLNEQKRLLYEISMVDFLIVDMSLYLDTHPRDREALEYLSHYNNVKDKLMKEFAMKFYPLSIAYAENCAEWKWGLAPAPWEGVC